MKLKRYSVYRGSLLLLSALFILTSVFPQSMPWKLPLATIPQAPQFAYVYPNGGSTNKTILYYSTVLALTADIIGENITNVDVNINLTTTTAFDVQLSYTKNTTYSGQLAKRYEYNWTIPSVPGEVIFVWKATSYNNLTSTLVSYGEIQIFYPEGYFVLNNSLIENDVYWINQSDLTLGFFATRYPSLITKMTLYMDKQEGSTVTGLAYAEMVKNSTGDVWIANMTLPDKGSYILHVTLTMNSISYTALNAIVNYGEAIAIKPILPSIFYRIGLFAIGIVILYGGLKTQKYRKK